MDTETAIELWHERAAIREFDGGFEREQAEYLAVKDVERMAGKELPAVRYKARKSKMEMRSTQQMLSGI
ncbi:MAG: hypothetical protein AAGD07_24220 [Planctomycetota bacterium]